MEGLEKVGMAHTDISPGNVMVGFDPIEVQLVDLEDMYMPGIDAPLQPHSGSAGYSHRSGETTWKPEGDRYAAAVLAAEMLVLAKPELARKATDEGFFTDHCQTPEGIARFQEARPWLEETAPEFAKVFERCWYADSLEGCPSISELREPIKGLATQPLLTESPKRVETPILRQPSPGPEVPLGTTETPVVGGGAPKRLPKRLIYASLAVGLIAALAYSLTGEETADFTLASTLTGPGPVTSVAFSPDGSLLASGSWKRTVELWDLRTGEKLRTVAGNRGNVESVAFSPDGSLLAYGGWDNTVKLWDPQSGKELQTLSGHSDGVQSVAFSPDGGLLASGSTDGTVKLWARAEGG